jgi:uncharacterized membrane protein YbaN (DUF454 family)
VICICLWVGIYGIIEPRLALIVFVLAYSWKY